MAVIQYTSEEIVEITNNHDNQIGQGGFATIFKGTINRGERHEQTVAVKVYDMLNASETQRKQFKAELVCLSELKHENIVKLIGYVQDEEEDEDKDADANTLMIVLEYIPTPLLQVINDLDWQDTLRILRQTASALQYIHGYGDGKYILMDFKTENIMIDEANRAKIVDFGSILKQGGYVITYSKDYAAPEVMRPVTNPTQKADVYSFGIVMLQLMMKLDKVEDASDSSNKVGGKKVNEASSSKGKRVKHDESPIVQAAKDALTQKRYYVNKDLVGLKKKCREDVAIRITELALDCTKFGANVRPTMEEVVRRLNEF